MLQQTGPKGNVKIHFAFNRNQIEVERYSPPLKGRIYLGAFDGFQPFLLSFYPSLSAPRLFDPPAFLHLFS